MKKFLLAALSVMFLFTLVGCPEDDPGTTTTDKGTKLTVTFNPNYIGAATSTKTVTKYKGKDATLGTNMPADPTQTDFKFVSWNTKNDGSGNTFTGASKIVADITVYAQWEVQEFELIVTAANNASQVKVGETLQFTAKIEPANAATITMEIVGTVNAGTTLTNGLLSVHVDETAKAITVQASATIDGKELIGSCTVLVADADGKTYSLDGLKVKKNPTTTTYYQDEDLDFTGAEIAAVWVDAEGTESEEIVDPSILDVSPSSFAGLKGTVEVTVTLTIGEVAQSAKFNVTVKERSARDGDNDAAFNAQFEQTAGSTIVYTMAEGMYVDGAPVAGGGVGAISEEATVPFGPFKRGQGVPISVVNGGLVISERSTGGHTLDFNLKTSPLSLNVVANEYQITIYAFMLGENPSLQYFMQKLDGSWGNIKEFRSGGDYVVGKDHAFKVVFTLPMDYPSNDIRFIVEAGSASNPPDFRVSLFVVENLGPRETVDVTFDEGYTGGKTETKQITKGTAIGTLPVPESRGPTWLFRGWFVKDENGEPSGNAIGTTLVVNEPLSLIGKWEELSGCQCTPTCALNGKDLITAPAGTFCTCEPSCTHDCQTCDGIGAPYKVLPSGANFFYVDLNKSNNPTDKTKTRADHVIFDLAAGSFLDVTLTKLQIEAIKAATTIKMDVQGSSATGKFRFYLANQLGSDWNYTNAAPGNDTAGYPFTSENIEDLVVNGEQTVTKNAAVSSVTVFRLRPAAAVEGVRINSVKVILEGDDVITACACTDCDLNGKLFDVPVKTYCNCDPCADSCAVCAAVGAQPAAPLNIPLIFQEVKETDADKALFPEGVRDWKVLAPTGNDGDPGVVNYDGISATFDLTGLLTIADLAKYDRISVQLEFYENETATVTTPIANNSYAATLFEPWKGDSADEGYGGADFPAYSNPTGVTGRMWKATAAADAQGWVTANNNLTALPEGLRVEREGADNAQIKAIKIIALKFWNSNYIE